MCKFNLCIIPKIPCLSVPPNPTQPCLSLRLHLSHCPGQTLPCCCWRTGCCGDDHYQIWRCWESGPTAAVPSLSWPVRGVCLCVHAQCMIKCVHTDATKVKCKGIRITGEGMTKLKLIRYTYSFIQFLTVNKNAMKKLTCTCVYSTYMQQFR